MTSTSRNLAPLLVAQALKIDVSLLSPQDRIGSIPEWDSLAQLEIVEAIEEYIGLEIMDDQTFDRLTSIRGIELYLEEHGHG